MCGIVGIFPAKINTENITQKAKETVIRVLSTEILVNLQERGKDATGTFVHFDSGEWLTIKQPVPADEFVLNISSAKYPGQEEEVNYRSFLLEENFFIKVSYKGCYQPCKKENTGLGI